jgi:diguanylate cyclase (GGDEF)-like protein
VTTDLNGAKVSRGQLQTAIDRVSFSLLPKLDLSPQLLAPSVTDRESGSAQILAIQLYRSVMQRRLEQMFEDRAYLDPLTGLPNRLLLGQMLNLALANLQSPDEFLAIVLLDLDRFKNINDRLGHSFGDRLLQLVAKRLQNTVDRNVVIGRWSGDEFMLSIPALHDLRGVDEIAARILHCFDLPFTFEQNLPTLDIDSVYIKVSMGIAISTGAQNDLDTLLKNADAALYSVKQHGKNNYAIYPTAVSYPVVDRFKLEYILDRAIIDRQLFLHYQPQIDLQTKKIVGVESLLRCQDLTDLPIDPADFIPIAEETGAIVPIGAWVLRTACHQNKLWQSMGLGYFPIAVNLSLKQLQDRKIVELIANILTETELSPTYLEIEITESIAIEDLNLTIGILTNLREIGVKISLDDFGTGHSSLAALKYLPLDRLKIDRSFIRELQPNNIDAKIVKTIINLGHELDLDVIAEGVETVTQFEFLRSIDCGIAQGFLFSRPLPATDLETTILKSGYWHHQI